MTTKTAVSVWESTDLILDQSLDKYNNILEQMLDKLKHCLIIFSGEW